MLRDQGVRDVLVTLGTTGSMMFEEGISHPDDAIRMKSFEVDNVVDSTGCGDCFRAGFVRFLACSVEMMNQKNIGEFHCLFFVFVNCRYSTARYANGHSVEDSLMFGSAAAALLVGWDEKKKIPFELVHSCCQRYSCDACCYVLQVQQVGAMTAPSRQQVIDFLNDRNEAHPFA